MIPDPLPRRQTNCTSNTLRLQHPRLRTGLATHQSIQTTADTHSLPTTHRLQSTLRPHYRPQIDQTLRTKSRRHSQNHQQNQSSLASYYPIDPVTGTGTRFRPRNSQSRSGRRHQCWRFHFCCFPSGPCGLVSCLIRVFLLASIVTIRPTNL